jgi:Niemann-Pick C1 protein
MGGAGLSVAVTTLASMVAFALGTLVPLPSIKGFSVFATMSVLCICIIQVRKWVGGWVGWGGGGGRGTPVSRLHCAPMCHHQVLPVPDPACCNAISLACS